MSSSSTETASTGEPPEGTAQSNTDTQGAGNQPDDRANQAAPVTGGRDEPATHKPEEEWYDWEFSRWYDRAGLYAILTLCLVILVTSAMNDRLLPTADCGFPLSAFIAFFGFSSKTHDPCSVFPVVADAPSIILAGASIFTAALNAKLMRYRRSFRPLSIKRGLISHREWRRIEPDSSQVSRLSGDDPAMVSPAPKGRLETFFDWIADHPRANVAAFAAFALLGIPMFISYENGYIFRTISQSNLDAIQSNWWASASHGNWPMAVCWVAVGALGATFALRNVAMNMAFTLRIKRLQSAEFVFQPTWLKVESPWDLMLTLTSIKIYGFASIIIALVGLIYMLGEPSPTRAMNYILLFISLGCIAVFAGQYFPSRHHVKFIYIKAFRIHRKALQDDQLRLKNLVGEDAAMRLIHNQQQFEMLYRYADVPGFSTIQSIRPVLTVIVPVITAGSSLARLFLRT